MPNNLILVGVTGGIGTGKTTVCRLFEILRIPVYSADEEARKLMETDKELILEIKKAFGDSAYLSDGRLNREYLAGAVFSEKQKIFQLNRLVHPKVGDDFARWVIARRNRNCRYVIKEAALLFESGSYKELDYLVTVTAPPEERIKRVMLRDPHRTVKQIEQIIEQQWPDEQKACRSDFVIHNDNRKMLIPQVMAIHQFLSK